MRLVLFAALAACAFWMAYLTVSQQFAFIHRHYYPGYVLRDQPIRHDRIIDRSTVAPYRYRLLTDFVIHPFVKDATTEAPWYWVRIVQNSLIFLAFLALLTALRLPVWLRLSGLGLFAYSCCQAFWESDLSFYTYTELLWFILTALCVIQRWYAALPVLAFLAGFTRESGVMLLVLPVAAALAGDRAAWKWAVFSAIAFAAAFGLAHWWAGPAPGYSRSRYGEVYPGIDLFIHNWHNPQAWRGLWAMYSVIPLILLALPWWPALYRWLLPLFVLPWFLAQFAFGSADETRLFLPPLAVVLIPALLLVIQRKFGCIDRAARIAGEEGRAAAGACGLPCRVNDVALAGRPATEHQTEHL